VRKISHSHCSFCFFSSTKSSLEPDRPSQQSFAIHIESSLTLCYSQANAYNQHDRTTFTAPTGTMPTWLDSGAMLGMLRSKYSTCCIFISVPDRSKFLSSNSAATTTNTQRGQATQMTFAYADRTIIAASVAKREMAVKTQEMIGTSRCKSLRTTKDNDFSRGLVER